MLVVMKPTQQKAGNPLPTPGDGPKRKPITPEDKIRMTLLRFELDGQGRLQSVEDVAGRVGRNVAVVSRAIASAFAERLVEVRRVEADSVVRLPALEERIKQRYRELCGVVVVREVPMEGEDPRSRNDRIHRNLGWAMGELIATGTLFRDKDRIGLGSGRGVFYTVEALVRKLPLSVGDVTIGSLTGSVYARDHSGQLNHMLDADNHTAHLAGCFSGRAQLRLISHPIAFKTPSALKEVQRLTWLGEWDERSRPTHALMGVGALIPGHRLHEEARSSDKNEWLSPIAEFVEPLVDICDSIRSRFPRYCPVMDLCNRFFFVEPPPDVQIDGGTRDDIGRLLAGLNERLLTVTPEQLAEIESIILVAGGENKDLIVKNLLRNRSRYHYRVRYLCTDSLTASALLDD